MDEAFAELQREFTSGAIKIALSLLYLIVPMVVVLMIGYFAKLRGSMLKIAWVLGVILGLFAFILYGLPSISA